MLIIEADFEKNVTKKVRKFAKVAENIHRQVQSRREFVAQTGANRCNLAKGRNEPSSFFVSQYVNKSY